MQRNVTDKEKFTFSEQNWQCKPEHNNNVFNQKLSILDNPRKPKDGEMHFQSFLWSLNYCGKQYFGEMFRKSTFEKWKNRQHNRHAWKWFKYLCLSTPHCPIQCPTLKAVIGSTWFIFSNVNFNLYCHFCYRNPVIIRVISELWVKNKCKR